MGFPVSTDFPPPLYIGRSVYQDSFVTGLTNHSWFIPVVLHKATTFNRMDMRCNPVLGNYDIGVYNSNFVRLVSSGSTACLFNNTAIFSISLSPGQYWLAVALSDPLCGLGSFIGNIMGKVRIQAATFPLPLNAAPVESSNFIELIPTLTLYRV